MYQKYQLQKRTTSKLFYINKSFPSILRHVYAFTDTYFFISIWQFQIGLGWICWHEKSKTLRICLFILHNILKVVRKEWLILASIFNPLLVSSFKYGILIWNIISFYVFTYELCWYYQGLILPDLSLDMLTRKKNVFEMIF